MIEPTEYHINIVQGATWNPTLSWFDSNNVIIDLNTWSAKMQARTSIGAPDPPAINLSSTINLTLTGVTGIFNPYDLITGATSLATGRVISYNATTMVLELSQTIGTFVTEVINDTSSGATGTISSISTNNGITLASTAPNISLYLSSETTEALTIATGVYDLFLTDSSGNATKLLYGKVKIWPNVTK